jgi:monofunctional biosynthetic peptidoglycan transglycosylase
LAPKGFTRRYGNMISVRIGTVAGEGLDACVYRNAAAPADRPDPVAPKRRKAAPQPALQPVPGEELEQPQAAPPPAQPGPDDAQAPSANQQ